MDVKQIERLEAWLRIAPDMGGCFELPEDCRDDIDALLQLARAVSEARVVTVAACRVEHSPEDFIEEGDIALPADDIGKRFALLPVPGEEGK